MSNELHPEGYEALIIRIAGLENMLREVLEKDSFEVMDSTQLSNWIGWKVSTINQKVSKKEIPHSRPKGSNPLFIKKDIIKWLIDNNIQVKADSMADREAELIRKRKAAVRN